MTWYETHTYMYMYDPLSIAWLMNKSMGENVELMMYRFPTSYSYLVDRNLSCRKSTEWIISLIEYVKAYRLSIEL